MEKLFRDIDPPSEQEVVKCPFLRNIHEPTNFSSSSSSLPARGGKGPIFEDGPNFDMAFRLFHGNEGVVPLSVRGKLVEPETAFNPLAAKAASISLSFNLDAFSGIWKNQTRKRMQNTRQPVMSGSKGGIAVAKAFEVPAGMKVKAARAALAKNLPEKVPLGLVVRGRALHSHMLPKSAMAFTIAASILGQLIGSRLTLSANRPLNAKLAHFNAPCTRPSDSNSVGLPVGRPSSSEYVFC